MAITHLIAQHITEQGGFESLKTEAVEIAKESLQMMILQEKCHNKL